MTSETEIEMTVCGKCGHIQAKDFRPEPCERCGAKDWMPAAGTPRQKSLLPSARPL